MLKNGNQRRNRAMRLSGGSALIALALGIGVATPVQAQDAAAPAEEAAAPVEGEEAAIMVTGSRIIRNGFNAPTPVTVVDAELINNLGQVNIADTLKLIPQNSNFQSDASAGITAGGNVGSTFANLRGLNPFFGTRTLTLVNSRRFIPTSDGGAVDLNVIPSAMIQRVETVTGGASAAYGSDAIAGVVNILLDTKFTGVKAQADFGQTTRGDGESYHASLTYGTSFAGDRGHIVVGGEYQKNKGIGDCSDVRGWCAESYDVFTNASTILPGGGVSGYDRPGTPGFGQPNFIVGPGSKQAYNDPRGVVRDRTPTAPGARNFAFNEAGTAIVPFNPGQYVSSSLTGPRQGGDGASTYDDSDLQTPVRRIVGYLYGEYALTESLKLSTELTYANRRASNTGVTAGPRSTFFVKPNNAYLPASLRTLLAGTQFSLGKDLDNQLESFNEVESNVFRGLIGLDGELGGSWKWNAYYQYGRNTRRQDRTNSRVNTPFQYALDAVVNPANGQIVCAELLKAVPNPLAQGCKPLNLFGTGALDPEAVAYAYRPVLQEFRYKQHVLSGAVQGEVFKGWGAGPISTAVGIDYRSEGGSVYNGDIPNYTDYAFTFGLDYAGDIEVLEGFTELNVPVFRDFALGESLDLDGAIRYTRNHAKDTVSGEQKTSEAVSWKVSGIYDITGGLRLRGSRSRDIRAAGFRELFLKNVATESGSSQGKVDNRYIDGAPAGGDDDTPILSGGSFSLTPEKADTTTLGVVYSPRFVPGLRLSVDWYQIKLNDAVTTLSGQRIVDFCYDYDLFCDRITSASDRDITFVDARQVNLARLTLRGVDLEAEYQLPLSDISADWNGRLAIRVLGTHQYDFISKPNQAVPGRDYAGQSGPVADAGDFNPAPKWIWNSFISYDVGGFNATASIRRIGKGILNVERIGPEDEGYSPGLINSISTNRVEGATYVGLAMSYEIPLGSKDRNVEIFGTVDNLFDKKPPVAPGGGGLGGSNYPTNPVYFDTFGSRYRMGVRVHY